MKLQVQQHLKPAESYHQIPDCRCGFEKMRGFFAVFLIFETWLINQKIPTSLLFACGAIGPRRNPVILSIPNSGC